MAITERKKPIDWYFDYYGLSTDDKPTGVPIGSTFFETNTGIPYETPDGENWVAHAGDELASDLDANVDAVQWNLNIASGATPPARDGTLRDASYHAHFVEFHVHTLERWFGKSADQTGDNWATAAGLTLFRAISGDGNFGADANDEAKILGADDTPIGLGMTMYDPHRMMVYAASTTTPWVLRVIYGTGTMADAEAAGQYTDIMVVVSAAPGAGGDSSVFEIGMPRLDSGTQLWARAKNATDNATIDFFIGLHEYMAYHPV